MILIDEIEHLATRLNSLREAEELAIQAQPQMVQELRHLHREALKDFYSLVLKLFKGRIELGVKPKIPMEVLERLFAVLRDQAEIEWSRSLKLTPGVESRKGRASADRLARLAGQAASALRITAESRGIWNDEYAAQHGLDPWA
jgi:hypothetical protein